MVQNKESFVESVEKVQVLKDQVGLDKINTSHDCQVREHYTESNVSQGSSLQDNNMYIAQQIKREPETELVSCSKSGTLTSNLELALFQHFPQSFLYFVPSLFWI
jgi:hypothetical protein